MILMMAMVIAAMMIITIMMSDNDDNNNRNSDNSDSNKTNNNSDNDKIDIDGHLVNLENISQGIRSFDFFLLFQFILSFLFLTFPKK